MERRHFLKKTIWPSLFKYSNICRAYQLNTQPVPAPQWGLLDSPEKMSVFQKISWVERRSTFSTGETIKPAVDDMKIQCGELTNILR